MKTEYSVSLQKIADEFSLEMVYSPIDPNEILIKSTEINKPGIQFGGYYEFYDNTRIQIIGKLENSFLYNHSTAECMEIIDKFFSTKPPVVILTREL